MLGHIQSGLKVIIVRNKPRGVLKAYVEQEAADGVVRGSDLLKGKGIIHLASAQHYIQWMQFPQVAIEWVVEEGANQLEENGEWVNRVERDPYAAPVKHEQIDDDDVPF